MRISLKKPAPPAPTEPAAIETASRQWRADLHASEQSRQHLLHTTVAACDQGMSEMAAAKHAGVTRLTVRKWRGKGVKKKQMSPIEERRDTA